MTTRLDQFLGILGGIALSFSAAAIGAMASASAGAFYAELDRPAWAPPAWLFAPVWTVLYLSMGVAAGLVWNARRRTDPVPALALFVVQLVLNVLWTWMFFVWQLGAGSFVGAVVLALLIAWTAVAFWRRVRLAGYLLLPYLLWVGFASVLTYAVWQRNPQLLG